MFMLPGRNVRRVHHIYFEPRLTVPLKEVKAMGFCAGHASRRAPRRRPPNIRHSGLDIRRFRLYFSRDQRFAHGVDYHSGPARPDEAKIAAVEAARELD